MLITELDFRLLLIEDNKTEELLFLKQLKKAGITLSNITIATTEKQVIKEVADCCPTIAFINFNFNKNKAASLIKKLRTTWPSIPIVLLLSNKKISKGALAALSGLVDDDLYLTEITGALLKKCIYYVIDKNTRAQVSKETAERNTLLTKATNNIVWDWDINKHAAYWAGNGLREILGYAQYEMLVDTDFWENNLHPEDKDRVTKKLNNIFKKAKVNNWSDEYRFKNKGGNYVYIYDRGFIIYEDGKPVRMIGSMEDVTDKKSAEASLLRSEKNYKDLFDKNPLPTFIWSTETYKILEANDTALMEYGYTKPEFLKLDVFSLRPSREREKFKHRVVEIINEKKLKHENIWIHIHKNGDEMLMQVSSYKITFNGKSAVLVLSKNITERTALTKKLEAEKNNKRKQIAEAVVAAQEKERTGIGKELHDNVNQLLSASRLYIEAAKTDKVNSINLLSLASEYIMNAIEEIRVLSKALNTPIISEMGFIHAVENLTNDLMILNNIHINFEKDDFDETALHENFKLTLFRIIQEQITNILKHSKGSVATVKLVRSCTEITLHINDNGIGFDTQKKATGIGLLNINSRAALYKGHVNICSEINKGTTLTITFPLVDSLEDLQEED